MRKLLSKPEFCPNPDCRFYDPKEAVEFCWYTHFGKFYTRCRGWIQRFRCSYCGKTCSTQTFSIHYWTHSTNDLIWLLHLLVSSSGLRQIARFAGVSYRVIQNRVRRLARNSLSVMDVVLATVELNEDLAFDGFESYTRSQYHPNNFTSVVGCDSQFFYAVVHTLLRRKGSMRPSQKFMRSLIDSVFTAPSHGIRNDCLTMFSDLSGLIENACIRGEQQQLFSDRHQAYVAALKLIPSLAEQLASGHLIHHRVSSRKPRTTSNPLFPVNYLDRQIRKNMGEHVRETVKQGREVNCQMERMAIFMFMHNFLTPHRIDDSACVADSSRHATYAKIHSPEVIEGIKRMLTHRHLWGHNRCNHQWIRRIWLHLYENPPSVRLTAKGIVTRSVALPPRGLPAHFLA